MNTTAIIVTVYFVLMIGWGLYTFIKNGNKETTIESEFIGDRSYKTWPLLATLVAAWGSNYTLIAAAQSGFDYGISGVIWYAPAIAIPLILFSWPLNIPKRIRQLYPDGLTFIQVIGKRYDEKARMAALIILLVANVFFIISIVLAVGIMLKALMGISLSLGIILGGTVMVVYIALNNFDSLIYGRVFQLALAGGAVAVAIILSIFHVFSFSDFVGQVSSKSGELLNAIAWGPIGMLELLISSMGFIFGSPILYQIAFSGRSDKEVTRAFRLLPITWAPFGVATAVMGVVAFLLYPNIAGQDAAMTLVVNVFPEWAAVLFFLGGLALVFSTADAAINNLASILIFDVFKKYKKTELTRKGAIVLSKLTQVALGVIGIVGALNLGNTVLEILVLNGMILIPFVFTIVLGLFWKRAHPTAAFWSMVLGMTSVIVLYYGFDQSIYTSFVGVLLSFSILVFGSLAATDKDTDYFKAMTNNSSKVGGKIA